MAAQREARLASSKLNVNGPTAINIEEKYRYMLAPAMVKGDGANDDAWDD